MEKNLDTEINKVVSDILGQAAVLKHLRSTKSDKTEITEYYATISDTIDDIGIITERAKCLLFSVVKY